MCMTCAILEYTPPSQQLYNESKQLHIYMYNISIAGRSVILIVIYTYSIRKSLKYDALYIYTVMLYTVYYVYSFAEFLRRGHLSRRLSSELFSCSPAHHSLTHTMQYNIKFIIMMRVVVVADLHPLNCGVLSNGFIIFCCIYAYILT